MFSITRTTITAAAVTASLVAALSTPTFADDKNDLEKHKKDVSGKIDDAKKDLEASSAAYAAAAKALKKAQGRLDAARSELSDTRGALATAKARDEEMQAQLARSEAQLDTAVTKLKDGRSRLKGSETKVREFTVQTVMEGDPSLRAISGLLQGQDSTTFSEEMSANEAISDDQTATMQRLDATRVILQLTKDKVEKLRDQVKVRRQEAAANLVRKAKLENAAEVQAAAVTELVGKRRSARNTAAKLKAQDAKTVRDLEIERANTEARLRALAAKDIKSGGKGVGGDGGGTLSMPANGPITSPYGMRYHPILHVYKLHDGTDFGIPCGTPVHAAAGGTVLQTYYNGAYGNRIILNNGIMRGKSVVTTYNHLTRWIVSPGQKVKRGQLIGYSGTTGYSTGCHLHFMVIVNGATVNPMGWL